jgi:drug/metabolite transporter (DMT)-like permease
MTQSIARTMAHVSIDSSGSSSSSTGTGTGKFGGGAMKGVGHMHMRANIMTTFTLLLCLPALTASFMLSTTSPISTTLQPQSLSRHCPQHYCRQHQEQALDYAFHLGRSSPNTNTNNGYKRKKGIRSGRQQCSALFSTTSRSQNNDTETETSDASTALTITMEDDSDSMSTTAMPELIPIVAEDMDDEEAEEYTYQRGLKTIALITLLFSSNSPVLHGAFSAVAADAAPPVLLMNAAVSTIALTGLLFSGPLLDSSIPLPCTLEEDDSALSCNVDDTDDNNNIFGFNVDALSLRAGFELGLVKMLGTTANLWGLSLTSAGHGAFLIQLTTLIVPLIQFLGGVPIPKQIWTAIGLALGGVFLFTHDPTTAVAAAAATGGATTNSITVLEGLPAIDIDTTLLGDGLCVVAAIFYATYDLRLFKWGKKVAPLKLIVNKVSTQAALSVLLLLACGFTESRDYLVHMMTSTTTSGGLFNMNNDALLVTAAALWSGLAINAVCPFLQVGAQQAVGATRAQVVYASQPLWAAILSYLFLNEVVGPEGLVGGALFLGAMFLAATAEAPDPNCEQEDNCEV